MWQLILLILLVVAMDLAIKQIRKSARRKNVFEPRRKPKEDTEKAKK